MVCIQILVYIIFTIIQTILSRIIIGSCCLNIFWPIILLLILYILCRYKFFILANILVGFSILTSIIVDIYALLYPNVIKEIIENVKKKD